MGESRVEAQDRIAANKRRFYGKRKAARLCVRCGERSEIGRTQCAACMSEKREGYKLKAQGALCVRCSSPRDSTRVFCAECRHVARVKRAAHSPEELRTSTARSRERRVHLRSDHAAYRAYLDSQKVVRERRKAARLCIRCCAPSEPSRTECADCLSRARERYRQKRAEKAVRP